MSEAAILVVEDDKDLGEVLCLTLEAAGYPTLYASDGAAALSLAAEFELRLIVSDVQMQPMGGLELLSLVREQHPGVPVILMTAYASVQKAVEAMQNGADTYLVKPFESHELLDAVERCLQRHRTITTSSVDTGAVVCGDEVTVRLLGLSSRVANSDATVLLSGESGTGKEVFARYIHENSTRKSQNYVALNCAAIPSNMLEAILFGYEKGAFTGAVKATPGKFEQANKGTLLLDEISEMDVSLQAKLLRVLQEREVERIGSDKTIDLDVRVLATTNRNLAAEVEAGRFREDLFYRLNVFPLHIPALRERRGDVLPLVRHMMRRFCSGQRAVPTLTPLAEKKLLQYSWPGNVRELENLIQRSLILLQGSDLCESDLAFETENLQGSEQRSEAAVSHDADLQTDLRDEEQRLILNALQDGAGNRQEVARSLGISARTLRYKIARLRDAGVTVPNSRGSHSVAAAAR